MEIEQVEFRQDLVGALMVEGYDELLAHVAIALMREGHINPFDGRFPTIRKALESLGVYDLPTMRERFRV